MAAQVLTPTHPKAEPASAERWYEYQETRDLVQLVNDAADLVRRGGEAAFEILREPGSRWRRDERYVFVLALDGRMLVHPDPTMEGRNEIELKDVNGKPIIRGLIAVATSNPDKPDGWYHYQWPVPGGLLPRWKSSYVRLVTAPAGTKYVVGAGIYDDRMEKGFAIDAVLDAVALIEKDGERAFAQLRDPAGPFVAKDEYVFVLDMNGIEIVNPAFPNLEGQNLFDQRDTSGRYPIRDMIDLANTKQAGWVDYMWPKPGESVSTRKSAYVSRAMLGGTPVTVGCGVYLAQAPKVVRPGVATSAEQLVSLVREAGALYARQGEKAFDQFRTIGSKWLHDDTYFIVLTLDCACVLDPVEPSLEGRDLTARTDVLGRPINTMMVEATAGPSGEGWVHYMYPEPGSLFPTWKSTFVTRATSPSGDTRMLASGIYNMQMEKAFIEDVVHRAAALVARDGVAAFDRLRDRKGPFVFMDTYVFVQSPDGVELVNPAFRSLEGRNLMDLRDLTGKAVIKDEIATALERGSAWIDLFWFKPGTNTPARKATFVEKVDSGGRTFIVGSGLYAD